MSRLLPREFEEIYLRIYIKNKAHLPIIHDCFSKWCKNQSKAPTNATNKSLLNSDDGIIPTTPSKRKRVNEP